MLWWCVRQQVVLHDEYAKEVGVIGDMSLIDECLSCYGRDMLYPLMAGAAASGVVAPVASLFGRLEPDEVGVVYAKDFKRNVSAGGSVEVAQLIYRIPTDWHVFDMVAGLKRGRLPFVQWALSDSVLDGSDGEFAVVCAAESGSMDLVRWLVDEKGYHITSDALCSATTAGRLDVLRWLHEQVGGDLETLLTYAVCSGQLHVVEWLLEQGCQLTEDTLYAAAAESTMATVAWLLDRGCPHDEETLVESSCRNIETGDVLIFLVETKHMKYLPDQCRSAAYEALVFDEAALHRVVDTHLTEDYFVRCVYSRDVGRFRYALEHCAILSSSTLEVMLNRDESVMVNETLLHHSVDGKLTDKFRVLLDEAVGRSNRLSGETVEVLARFGYQVSEKGKS
jgi:hypothetical protein